VPLAAIDRAAGRSGRIETEPIVLVITGRNSDALSERARNAPETFAD
jgi:hypothetical protein